MCPPSLGSMVGLSPPGRADIKGGRRPVPLGGEDFLPAAPSHAMGRKGLGAHCSLAPAPLFLPSCWVGGAVEGSRLSPGPGKTSVRGAGSQILAPSYGAWDTHSCSSHIHVLSSVLSETFPTFLVCACMCICVQH